MTDFRGDSLSQGRARSLSLDDPILENQNPTSMLVRAQTVSRTISSMDIPAELTSAFYDQDDRIFNTLLKEQKTKQISDDIKNEMKDDVMDPETEKLLKDIDPEKLKEWNTFIANNEEFKRAIQQGTMNESKFRKQFNIEEEETKLCECVDRFLLSKETKSSKPPMPVLSSWKEMVKLFGDAENLKACAPEYWEDEVQRGRGERARLVKVGVDVPAIWEIADAEQIITADLYITFTWQVNAKRDQIWDSVNREFKIPVWKIRLRSGKFITNLKTTEILDDEMSCGNEKSGKTTIIQRITMTADFSQEFQLNRFPFDEQEVKWVIRYWLLPYSQYGVVKRGRLIFYEDIAWECRVKKKALKPSDEWDVVRNEGDKYDKLNFISTVTDKDMDPKSGRLWPEISFSFKVKRNPEFMIWNIAFPITLIVVFGLIGNLTALYSDFDRTSFTAALLFTIFSIKSNVQYALSKVGYRTTLDSYILLSQAMVIVQGMVGVWFSHVSHEILRLELEFDLETFMLPIGFGIGGLIVWGFITFQFITGRSLSCSCFCKLCEDTDDAREENF